MRKKLFTMVMALFAVIALLMGLTACGATEYEIKFAADDGTTLSTLTVEEGEVPVYAGETPTKAATPQYTFTFAGWKDADGVVHSGALPAATANATYTAAFTQTGRSYTVTWSVNGTTTSKTLAYGAAVAYEGTAPTKENTAQYTYTFAGWNDGEKTYGPAETLPTVSKDVTYTAEFSSTVNSYTVTWHVGSETSTSSVEYGAKAVYGGAAPTKTPTASTVYTFAGWAKTENGTVLDDAGLTVTDDLTLYAVFTEAARKYTVKFVDENGTTELFTAQFEYNTVPAFSGTAPAKQATAQYSYTFAGWLDEEETLYGPSDTLPQVHGEMTFKAKYTSTVNKYTVTWSINGTETEAQFEYGATPAYEGTPAKPDTPEYSYTFDGWAATEGGEKLETLPAVEGDVTYYARFTQTDRQYTVTWNVDGTTTTTRVINGQAPVWEGEDPVKERDAQYTYAFQGWATSAESKETVTLSEQKITGDTTYYAVFSETINEYTVKFVVEGEETSATMQYGDKPTYQDGTDPVKEGTESTSYTFTGWNDGEQTYKTGADLPAVTGDVTYTAVFEEKVREYTVTVKHYKGLDGTTTIKEDTKLTLGYGTFLSAENSAIAAIDEGDKHYLPNMFYLGGIVKGDQEFIVRYTEADIWDGTSASESLTGQGTVEEPFLIQSAADLYYLANVSNNKNYGAKQNYKLTTSIDLAKHEWLPICYANGSGTWTYFEGNFDGGGYTIAGLHCDKPTGQGIGLFASVRNGEIKNLTIQGDLSAKSRAGGLAYFVNSETVSNITTFVEITLNAVTNEVYAGGIFGTTTVGTSTFTNLVSYGTINSTGKRVGGIIGNVGSGITVNITNCTNYGSITVATHAGGMIGQADGKVVLTGCVNYGNMTANTERAGGMIATQTGKETTLTNCTNYGKINAPNEASDKADATGGILGVAKYSTLTGCVNYGEVVGVQHTGGICGETTTVNVSECINYGDVKGKMTVSDRNKGFAGIVGWTTTSSNVTKCENHGNIEGNTNTGGICGYLGKGSTCPVEGENANTSDGTVTGNSAKGDIIGYDGNNA